MDIINCEKKLRTTKFDEFYLAKGDSYSAQQSHKCYFLEKIEIYCRVNSF